MKTWDEPPDLSWTDDEVVEWVAALVTEEADRGPLAEAVASGEDSVQLWPTDAMLERERAREEWGGD